MKRKDIIAVIVIMFIGGFLVGRVVEALVIRSNNILIKKEVLECQTLNVKNAVMQLSPYYQ